MDELYFACIGCRYLLVRAVGSFLADAMVDLWIARQSLPRFLDRSQAGLGNKPAVTMLRYKPRLRQRPHYAIREQRTARSVYQGLKDSKPFRGKRSRFCHFVPPSRSNATKIVQESCPLLQADIK